MTIGQAIKYYRKERGMTQEELTRALGYKDRSSITKIEKDISCPPISTLRRFAEVLGVDVWEIIGFNSVELDDIQDENPKVKELKDLISTLTDAELQRVHDFILGLIAARS